eukprot:11411579-Alexandrium_andersonii.AAC.1
MCIRDSPRAWRPQLWVRLPSLVRRSRQLRPAVALLLRCARSVCALATAAAALGRCTAALGSCGARPP